MMKVNIVFNTEQELSGRFIQKDCSIPQYIEVLLLRLRDIVSENLFHRDLHPLSTNRRTESDG